MYLIDSLYTAAVILGKTMGKTRKYIAIQIIHTIMKCIFPLQNFHPIIPKFINLIFIICDNQGVRSSALHSPDY